MRWRRPFRERFGVLPKDIAPEQLLRCLRQAAAGKEFSHLRGAEPTGIYTVEVEHSRAAPLTDRERGIAQLVSQGLSNKEIGRELSLSAGTVKIHLHRIYQKLALQNRTALAVLSAQADLSAEESEAFPASLSEKDV
jgi:two-component system nitrate/nitrite response regulator NarL